MAGSAALVAASGLRAAPGDPISAPIAQAERLARIAKVQDLMQLIKIFRTFVPCFKILLSKPVKL